MTEFSEKRARRPDDEDLGFSKFPLCREPWESFYILRRGVMPCCYGEDVIGDMREYADLWNGVVLQDIRSHLSRGELSPYCRRSPGCPIVQRVLREEKMREGSRAEVAAMTSCLPRNSGRGSSFPVRMIRRLFFGKR